MPNKAQRNNYVNTAPRELRKGMDKSQILTENHNVHMRGQFHLTKLKLGSARLGLAQFLLKLFGKKAQLCMSCLTHWQELQEATLAISYKVVT